MTAWGNVRAGDKIACPGDGHMERVLHTDKRKDGTVFVRTSRHDHFRDEHALVKVVEPWHA